MGFLHGIVVVFKFIFGLGALGGLVVIGLALLWYVLHIMVRLALEGQPAEQGSMLRKLFLLES